ncbi:MAG: flagellar biosynthesis protein FliA [Clostridia bacterium]|nr:flagellar biosynthesis protein FliA [Clostridia bacterium]
MFLNLLYKIASGIFYLALHVSPVGSFPPPLKKAEEDLLLKQFKNGDNNAKNKLIEHNLRLVAHIVKKYYTENNSQDDLISIGTIGLIKAVSTFKSDKGIRLATYAARCIDNATLSQMIFWLQEELPIGELPSRRQKICI